MTAPQPPDQPSEPLPQPSGEAPPAPPADPGHSIWRTLDGQPIPRRAVAAHAGAPSAPGAPSLRKTISPQQAYAQAAATAPSPAATRFVLATWWARLGAYLIDSFVLGLSALVITMPLCLAGGMTVEEALLFLSLAQPMPDSIANTGPMYGVLVLQLLLPPVAASMMLARWNGQTIGKHVAKIRVVRDDGAPVDLRSAVRREVLAKGVLLPILTVVTFGVALVANYLWPLWDPQSRAGHDFVARTRVVQAPRD